ncbi:hypothetical protein L21SP5_03314 [Salinivirga cyanobacteriivorans]|uniref:Uncharacterized protein n=1 Tax=Salinivirga cyanobacteriivorans TaxID=1307839 RepID=A0A0S2I3L2_9BACT|nr:hypothetical protein L21SP5_03314 [Salinivirga cyanobacteriivorans]
MIWDSFQDYTQLIYSTKETRSKVFLLCFYETPLPAIEHKKYFLIFFYSHNPLIIR